LALFFFLLFLFLLLFFLLLPLPPYLRDSVLTTGTILDRFIN
jgi:hypothetical protein